MMSPMIKGRHHAKVYLRAMKIDTKIARHATKYAKSIKKPPRFCCFSVSIVGREAPAGLASRLRDEVRKLIKNFYLLLGKLFGMERVEPNDGGDF